MFTKIVQASSTKPRTGNVIQLARNGYLYNVGTFSYKVNQATLDNFTVSLNNNYANSITTGLWVLTFSKGVTTGDLIYMNIPQSITVNNCQPQCLGCSCNFALPTPSTPFTQITITLGNLTSPLFQLTISTGHRNPI